MFCDSVSTTTSAPSDEIDRVEARQLAKPYYHLPERRARRVLQEPRSRLNLQDLVNHRVGRQRVHDEHGRHFVAHGLRHRQCPLSRHDRVVLPCAHRRTRGHGDASACKRGLGNAGPAGIDDSDAFSAE
jgi:hypothetical protein